MTVGAGALAGVRARTGAGGVEADGAGDGAAGAAIGHIGVGNQVQIFCVNV